MAALAFALRRQRWLLTGSLVLITCLSLGYTYWLATGFDMSGMMSPTYVEWSRGYFVFMLVMWIVMMIGMMTPSVAPTVLLYAEFARRGGQGREFPAAIWFAGGYLLAWAAFAFLATLLQWLLEWLALITPMMAGTSQTLAGAMLVAAGAYQWLPVKQACLAQCRSPLSFIQRHGGFQDSTRRTVRLGFLHGSYCIGCCWALMLLLFAFGVMELRWIAGLMIYVLLEKLLPLGPRAAATFARSAGVIAMIAGAALMVR
jgi:predicted metal-binding membrane protein